MKARNKKKHRVVNSKNIFNINNINSGPLKSSCGSGNQSIPAPQMSQSMRINRMKRGLGKTGARVINTSGLFTSKKMPTAENTSTKSYINRLKLQTIAEQQKGNNVAGTSCANNQHTNADNGSCTECTNDKNKRRRDPNIVKTEKTLTSSEYIHKLIPKRVNNIICNDKTKDKIHGNTISSSC